MHAFGRSGVADEADEIALSDMSSLDHPRARCFEVSEKQKIVAKLPCLAQRVATHHGGPEDRPDENDLGVSFLVLEPHHRDRRTTSLYEIDAAVSDLEPAAAEIQGADASSHSTLRIVLEIEVVAAHDASVVAWNRESIEVIVGGSLWTSWNLVVARPLPVPVAVNASDRLRRRRPRVVLRQTNARIAVRQRVLGARGPFQGGGGFCPAGRRGGESRNETSHAGTSWAHRQGGDACDGCRAKHFSGF